MGHPEEYDPCGGAGEVSPLDRGARSGTSDAPAGEHHRVIYDSRNGELARWFEQIVIIEGNHDDRISRATRGEVHLGMFLYGTDVRYSRYSYLYIKTRRGLVKVVHPENFSSDPVTLGQQFYDVEQGPRFDPNDPVETLEKCHFVVAHCHRQQAGMSKDGAYEIHTLGTMRERSRTRYVSKGQNKHNQWDSGFLVIEDGFFYPMNRTTTNWERELSGL